MSSLKKITTLFILLLTLTGSYVPAYAHGNHNHDHHHHHEKLPHQEGIFEDSEVSDRTLNDYSGDWQSVYPYMEAGELDMVMRYKANNGDKSFEEYKKYYLTGYQTDVQRIIIDGETGDITFYQGDKMYTATYHYDGYKILTYPSGKKGVRYCFSTDQTIDGAPKYIQFSDHEIAPTITEHFHIFMGNESHDALYEELENWPTYYPNDLDVYEIIDEMIAH